MSARIVFVCGREPEYVRNHVLLEGLQRHAEITTVTDSRRGSILARSARLLPRLARALTQRHDLVVVGFYGHLLVPLVRALTRRPIIFDAFLSTYDTLCFDRRVFSPTSIGGHLAYLLDSWACRSADHVLLDTAAHATYFVETFHLSPQRLSPLYTGCDEDLFSPRQDHVDENQVFFYSTYLPLHGVEYIVQAAQLVEAKTGLHFTLIGAGPEYVRVKDLAQRLKVHSLTFAPPVPYAHLPDAIARAAICLGGPFSDSPKAGRIITGKTFQFLAMGKPVIVGDSPATRELFADGLDVLMCRRADAQDLANTLCQLAGNLVLRRQLARNGQATYRTKCSLDVSAAAMWHIVERTLSERKQV